VVGDVARCLVVPDDVFGMLGVAEGEASDSRNEGLHMMGRDGVGGLGVGVAPA
jgi:hypothetical protein